MAAEFIARKELLACLFAVFCFGDLIKGRYVKLYTDNENVYYWLLKGRTSSEFGTKYIALWELRKYLLECKISPQWIPSDANTTADALSRGRSPEWLQRRGHKRFLPTEVRDSYH